MVGPEIQPGLSERLPDFESLAGKLADILAETENPAILTIIKNTLKFLDKPDNTKDKLNSEEFDRVKNYIEGLKNAPEKTQRLRDLPDKEGVDPDLKRLVAELLRYLNGEKNFKKAESVETAQSGSGIPISAPSEGTNALPHDNTPENNEEQPTVVREVPAENPDPKDTDPATKAKDTDSAAKATEANQTKEAEIPKNLSDVKNTAKHMSMGDLFKKFIELAKTLPDLLEDFSERLTGGTSAAAYSANQIKNSVPDFSKVNEAEPISSDNKSVEYVARVLNLPSKPNAEQFLTALKQSPNCVFETEKQISKLKAGDVLFFHDGQEKEKASVTAIVSDAEPPAKMKLVHQGENVEEIKIEQSSFFNNWRGYVRMPNNAKTTA